MGCFLAVDLVDHDLKMILGMIWAVILDYQIKGISVEGIVTITTWCFSNRHTDSAVHSFIWGLT
jgi:hypothetical protein